MIYTNLNLYLILTYMLGHNPSATIAQEGSGIAVYGWEEVEAPPTQAAVDATEASQSYIDWYAENGGDPVKTLRKQTSDSLGQDSGALLRSVILILVDEFNRHSDRTNAILTAVGNATSLSTLQTEVALINPIPARTGAQLRAAAIAKIDGGDTDS